MITILMTPGSLRSRSSSTQLDRFRSWLEERQNWAFFEANFEGTRDGVFVLDLNIRVPTTATIGGNVFNDVDTDGERDPEETGVAGVDVVLIDSRSVEVESYTTLGDGIYEFSDLIRGS